jgi:hypothetical protein
LEELTTSLNSSKNTLHQEGEEGDTCTAAAAEGEEEGDAEDRGGGGGSPTAATVANDCNDAVSTSMLFAGSTRRRCFLKKSTPMMGNWTSANRNVQSNRRPWKLSVIGFSPQESICEPLGPDSLGPEVEAEE